MSESFEMNCGAPDGDAIFLIFSAPAAAVWASIAGASPAADELATTVGRTTAPSFAANLLHNTYNDRLEKKFKHAD